MIKKYSNRRLYCTQSKCYIGLGDLRARLVKGDRPRITNDADERIVTAEVYAAVVLKDAKAGKISAELLAELIK